MAKWLAYKLWTPALQLPRPHASRPCSEAWCQTRPAGASGVAAELVSSSWLAMEVWLFQVR